MITEEKLQVAVFGLGLEVWFLSIGLCLHTQTLNSWNRNAVKEVPH